MGLRSAWVFTPVCVLRTRRNLPISASPQFYISYYSNSPRRQYYGHFTDEQILMRSLTQGHTANKGQNLRTVWLPLGSAEVCVPRGCHSRENAFPLRSVVVVQVKYMSTQQQKMSLTSVGHLKSFLNSTIGAALRQPR